MQNDKFAYFLEKDRTEHFTNLCADIDCHDFVPAVIDAVKSHDRPRSERLRHIVKESWDKNGLEKHYSKK